MYYTEPRSPGLGDLRLSAHHERDGKACCRCRVLRSSQVDERLDGVHLSYDRMASLLAPYENEEALKVAQGLDTKIEALLKAAAR